MSFLEKVPLRYKAGAVLAVGVIAWGAAESHSSSRLPFAAEVAVQTDHAMHGGTFNASDLSRPRLPKPVTITAIDNAAKKIGETIGSGDFGMALGYCSLAAVNNLFQEEPLGPKRQEVLAKVTEYSFATDPNRVPPAGVLEDCKQIDHELLVPGKAGYTETSVAEYGTIK